MKRVIVFGATGSIGIYLTEYLVTHLDNREYQVIAVGQRDTDYFERYNVPYISMSVTEPEHFSRLPQTNVYAAIHLANLLPARMTSDIAHEYIKVNTLGTAYLLEYLRQVNADRLLFSQTYADLAGHWEKEKCLGNALPRSLVFTGDHAVYTISKCAAVDLMEYFHQEYGLKNFVFRLPNIYHYSPEEYYYVNGEKRLISYRYIIRRAMKGEPIELWGNPNRGRDIVYIKDLCQMFLLALLSNRDNGCYNVGTGVMTSMKEQIEGIINVFSPKDRPSVIIPRPEKPDAMQYVMDITEAVNELGYKPQYDYISYLSDYKKEMMSSRFK